jgi:hypothetical protein
LHEESVDKTTFWTDLHQAIMGFLVEKVNSTDIHSIRPRLWLRINNAIPCTLSAKQDGLIKFHGRYGPKSTARGTLRKRAQLRVQTQHEVLRLELLYGV